MINEDRTTDEMWTILSEGTEYQNSSTVIEGEELKCIYKNYIYRGKNWECLICNAEDYCGHYHCTLY